MLSTYGLFDESNKGVSETRRAEIVAELTALLDRDGDGEVTKDEFTGSLADGKTLPDLGTGPGHHGDDEYEYEIHHWEKYVVPFAHTMLCCTAVAVGGVELG